MRIIQAGKQRLSKAFLKAILESNHENTKSEELENNLGLKFEVPFERPREVFPDNNGSSFQAEK